MSRREPITIKLSEPRLSGDISLEETMLRRRSHRRYTGDPLTLAEVSQLLWASQGITRPERGFRTAPSAGALYPLEVYLVVGDVVDLEGGIYKYRPVRHDLLRMTDGDAREDLAVASLNQRMVKNAAVDIVFTAVFERTTSKYGERGIRYVLMDAGFAAENTHLQVTALGLGTVIIGAFDDDAVKKVLSLPDEEYPLLILPMGRV